MGRTDAVFGFVRGKSGGVGKRISAAFTLVRLLPSVNGHVLLQVRFECEPLFTLFTLKRFHSGVNLHVSIQSAALCERLAAHRALKTAHASVNHAMRSQLILCPERLFTLITLVWFFSAVRLHVLSEEFPPCECLAAFFTLEHPVLMRLDVNLIILQRLEDFPALCADVRVLFVLYENVLLHTHARCVTLVASVTEVNSPPGEMLAMLGQTMLLQALFTFKSLAALVTPEGFFLRMFDHVNLERTPPGEPMFTQRALEPLLLASILLSLFPLTCGFLVFFTCGVLVSLLCGSFATSFFLSRSLLSVFKTI